MQARATSFSFSHIIAQFLSKAVVLHGCEVLRTMVARLRAMLKVAAGSVSMHAIIFHLFHNLRLRDNTPRRLHPAKARGLALSVSRTATRFCFSTHLGV